jgi:signal transduction histidine kinase
MSSSPDPPNAEFAYIFPGDSEMASRMCAFDWSRVELLATGFDTTRLPRAVEATAYRIVQEALTNVRKHAQARHVSVIAER